MRSNLPPKKTTRCRRLLYGILVHIPFPRFLLNLQLISPSIRTGLSVVARSAPIALYLSQSALSRHIQRQTERPAAVSLQERTVRRLHRRVRLSALPQGAPVEKAHCGKRHAQCCCFCSHALSYILVVWQRRGHYSKSGTRQEDRTCQLSPVRRLADDERRGNQDAARRKRRIAHALAKRTVGD